MRLSFFSHFDKRHLSHTSTNATSLFDSKRRYFAIAQYASLLRYFAIAQYASLLRYWLCQYAPLGWAIAGRRYAQLARLCARRWWRLARIRRALPSVHCPVHNHAEKTTKPAQRAGFPNKKKTTKPAQRAGFVDDALLNRWRRIDFRVFFCFFGAPPVWRVLSFFFILEPRPLGGFRRFFLFWNPARCAGFVVFSARL